MLLLFMPSLSPPSLSLTLSAEPRPDPDPDSDPDQSAPLHSTLFYPSQLLFAAALVHAARERDRYQEARATSPAVCSLQKNLVLGLGSGSEESVRASPSALLVPVHPREERVGKSQQARVHEYLRTRVQQRPHVFVHTCAVLRRKREQGEVARGTSTPVPSPQLHAPSAEDTAALIHDRGLRLFGLRLSWPTAPCSL